MSGDFEYFSFDYFIEGYKLIDFANRCAMRKICRPDPRAGAGARMDFILIFNIMVLYFVVSLYEMEEIKPMRQPLVVTVSLSLLSF
jgi:hypothetical protein